LGWHPVAVVQCTFTHKQYTEHHNGTDYTEQLIIIIIIIIIVIRKHNTKNTQFTKLNKSIQSIQPYIQR